MKYKIHKADSRGTANYGWLNSHHTFSFASFYDPSRMGFGKLRVINDDVVSPAMGFDTHSHENMEIISVPLSGSLRHEDSMGNRHVIEAGEVQAMSAGTGITHSEYNNSGDRPVKFLQIWVLPKEMDIQPRYDQKPFSQQQRQNRFQLIVSPDGMEESVSINQDAYFSRIDIEEKQSVEYSPYNNKNGVYLFVLSGSVFVEDIELNEKDGVELTEIVEPSSVRIFSAKNSELLLIEVPLH